KRSCSNKKPVRGDDSRKSHPTLSVQLLVLAEDAPLAERDTPLGGEIGGNAWTARDAVVQRNQPRHLPLEALHPLRKGVAHGRDDLEQRQVDIAEPAAQHVGTPAARDDALEIAQEFRDAVAPEIGRPQLRLWALVLV